MAGGCQRSYVKIVRGEGEPGDEASDHSGWQILACHGTFIHCLSYATILIPTTAELSSDSVSMYFLFVCDTFHICTCHTHWVRALID